MRNVGASVERQFMCCTLGSYTIFLIVEEDVGALVCVVHGVVHDSLISRVVCLVSIVFIVLLYRVFVRYSFYYVGSFNEYGKCVLLKVSFFKISFTELINL